MGEPPALVPTRDRAGAFDQGGERVANEAPALPLGKTAHLLAFEGDTPCLGAVAGDADREERAEDDGVLGL